MDLAVAANHKTRDKVRLAVMTRMGSTSVCPEDTSEKATGQLGGQKETLEKDTDRLASPAMDELVDAMRKKTDDFVQCINGKSQMETMERKVDQLIYSIDMVRKRVTQSTAEKTVERVQSIDFVELLFQPRRGSSTRRGQHLVDIP
jgi:hypothetical protein